jgi:hypothetical protein
MKETQRWINRQFQDLLDGRINGLSCHTLRKHWQIDRVTMVSLAERGAPWCGGMEWENCLSQV